ncbi:hypothetical protein DL93DRAFT_2064630 [Clavulina sp. PMI_390]|nr:hypothetical protein DL93DRAFT_2064630 [Clavulina sp. PMI_390]
MAPTQLSTIGSFDLKSKVKLNFTDVTVSKWQSRESGLTVVHLDYDAPIVKGYFVVATEIFNDSGVPHTLEHLIFMGSEKYPYKGVLDNLANRAFAAGTNAWTDTDHTAYTIDTAGEQGFLQFLPIYVDHILYPTITDASFVTEVHHINPAAEDAGVVYSEMQGRENTSGDLASLRQQRLFYPKDSAYRSETGGLMEALRKLTADEIRQYHSSYYVPHNLCLIVAGKLSTQALLETVQSQVEPRIIAHKQANGPVPPGWKRPFLETPSATPFKISEPREDTVEFPEKDESLGELMLSFVGPSYADYLDRKAIDILGIYLTDTSVAPLTKEYVEIAEPLCTWIGFYENTRASFIELAVYFGSVPTEQIDGLSAKFKESLQRIIKEGVDMERMALVLKKDRLKVRISLESQGGDFFSGHVISDFLYGSRDGKELDPAMAEIARYEELGKWTSAQWANLLEKYYVNNQAVIIKSKPSAALSESLEKTEKARVAGQKESLGPAGLERVAKLLEDSKKEHEIPIPSEILTSFPVPDVKSISWIPVQSYLNEPSSTSPSLTGDRSLEEHVKRDGKDLPLFVHYLDVKSDFITLAAYISTASIPENLKPYITLYQSSLFSLPVTQASTGTKLTHEEVVKALDNDIVDYGVQLGMGEYFTDLIRIGFRVEKSGYEKGIAWLRDLLHGSEFDVERLKVTAAKIQQGLPEMKRDGNTVANALFGEALWTESSASKVAGLMKQIEFNPALVEKLKAEPEAVVADLKKFRSYVTDPANLRIAVTGSITSLPEPRTAFSKHYEPVPSVKLAPVPWQSQSLSELGKNPVKKGIVLSLPTIESSYGIHVTRIFQGWDHPDAAIIKLACEVLDGSESFLWKYIRGSGLAYGANLGADLENGLLSLTLYKCPNSYQAYAEGAKVVKGICDGSIPIEQTTLDAAKSSLVYSVAQSMSSPGKAASMAFVNETLRGVESNYGRGMLETIQPVTVEQIRETITKYILPLFNAESSVSFVVSAPGKADEIKESLEKYGFSVESRSLEVSDEDMEGSESGSDDGSDDSDTSMHSK